MFNKNLISLVFLICFSIIFSFYILKKLDRVSYSYKDLNELQKTDIIKNGWVPRFLPITSVKIKGWYNIDTNQSEGELKFTKIEWVEYTIKIIKNGGRLINKIQTLTYEFEGFILEIDTQNEKIRFSNKRNDHENK